MMRKLALALVTATIGALSACGGGDDGPAQPDTPAAIPGDQGGTPGGNTPPDDPPDNTPPDDTPPPGPPALTPACEDCAATDTANYAGSGVGVWRYVNASARAVDVPVSIAGLDAREVTLVFTNPTGRTRIMPDIPLTTRLPLGAMQPPDPAADLKRRIAEFNRDGWARLLGTRSQAPLASVQRSVRKGTVDDRRNWNDAEDRPRATTLVRQREASDGTTVNFWVEDAEHGAARVTDAMLDRMADWLLSSGKLYDKLKSIGGPFWGPHRHPAELIPGEGQPLHIVIINMTPDAAPYGLMGYFYARDMMHGPEYPSSNHAVTLFFDSETMYLDGERGLKSMGDTMSHEAMHLQNFYRRGVSMGPAHSYDTWLDETTAIMVQDFTGDVIDPSMNAIRDMRFPTYIASGRGMYQCSLTAWDSAGAACDSYAVGGSLGGFLNRQLGLGFYKRLLTQPGSRGSIAVLDSAITTASADTGFAEQFRRFAATSGSLMPASGSPAGYGYPARAEDGFSLPVIDPRALLPLRKLIQTVPVTLDAYANVPVVRDSVMGVYQETVTVPPGTMLSVVVQ